MSKIGRRTILIPDSVKIVQDDLIKVEGSKGILTLPTNPLINVLINRSEVEIKRVNDTKQARSMHGLYRSLIKNMVEGVTSGYEIKLEMKGVGYRAIKQGENLVLSLGFSHPITVTPSAGIELNVEKNIIIVHGIDKQLVGETAALIRRHRPPEPYKGKGIRYIGEKIRMKAGKAAKAAGAK